MLRFQFHSNPKLPHMQENKNYHKCGTRILKVALLDKRICVTIRTVTWILTHRKRLIPALSPKALAEA